LHPARWVKRTEMQAHRSAVPGAECKYSCALNQTLGKEYFAHLSSLAPEIEGCSLAEVVVNRYEPGDFIPEHLDRTVYPYNLMIHLEDSDEDGLMIEDTFYPLREGRMTVFKGAGLLHSVPPVKNERYTLIYLYERGERTKHV